MQNIANIATSQMSAALHVQFHTAVLTHLTGLSTDSLAIDDAVTQAYTDAIAAEQDFVNRPLASEYTARIQDLDQTRDALTDDILGRLRGARVHPDAQAKAAYATLKNQILDRYPASLKAENYQRESALIQGLLVDLAKMNPAVLKTLGVDTLMEELEQVNERFTKAYLSRNAERVRLSATDLPSLRAATDEAYAQICAQLTYTANRPDAALAALPDGAEQEKARAQRDLARRAVAEMNEHIAYFKTHYIGASTAKNASAAGTDAPAPDAGTDTDTDGADAGSTPPGGNAGDTGHGPTTPDDVTEVSY